VVTDGICEEIFSRPVRAGGGRVRRQGPTYSFGSASHRRAWRGSAGNAKTGVDCRQEADESGAGVDEPGPAGSKTDGPKVVLQIPIRLSARFLGRLTSVVCIANRFLTSSASHSTSRGTEADDSPRRRTKCDPCGSRPDTRGVEEPDDVQREGDECRVCVADSAGPRRRFIYRRPKASVCASGDKQVTRCTAATSRKCPSPR